MRYLLDTNAYIYWATDQDLLDVYVYDRLNEPNAVLCISAESVRELIVAYNAKGWGNKRWKTAEDMVDAIEQDYYIEILPIQKDFGREPKRLYSSNNKFCTVFHHLQAVSSCDLQCTERDLQRSKHGELQHDLCHWLQP